jgi:hypothetical protein
MNAITPHIGSMTDGVACVAYNPLHFLVETYSFSNYAYVILVYVYYTHTMGKQYILSRIFICWILESLQKTMGNFPAKEGDPVVVILANLSHGTSHR